MGNNIEENIEILESIIRINNDYLQGIENQTINQKEIKALEHILLNYKRVLKENEEFKIKNKTLEELLQGNLYELYKYYRELADTYQGNCIPVQKIKDIIDRIDYDIKKTKEIISKNTNIYASYRKNDYQIVRLRAMNTKSLDIRKRLQELLESEE